MSELKPGMIFGRDFRIVKELRAGGMGAVYIADQLSTGKQRALKVMAPELALDPPTRERFVLEARAAAKIESDHVVEIVTAGVDEETGAPFLVMELLRGEELADAAARLGPLPLGDVVEVVAQVGHALEQAHAQGIVHRDLKPENIFLATSRRRDVPFTAKILDFGIAKLVEDSRQKTGTQPLGTPLFMAPEQTDRKGRILPATDVWALGLIVFKLITGRDFWLEADGSLAMLLREICVEPIPFASIRVTQLAARAFEDAQVAGALPGAAPLPSIPPVPPGFDAWFARCVNRDVDARFQNAGEAVRAFADLSTADAPRGALIASTGPVDWSGSGATTGGVAARSAAQQSSVRIKTGEGAIDGRAATGLATGAPMVQTAPPTPSRTGVKAGVVAGVVAVALGGLFAYRSLVGRDGGAGTPPNPPGSTTASTASTPSATATAAAAATGTCPEGTVLIQGGKMFLGARDLAPDAKPPHEVTVSGFCLDKTEVTTRAYGGCVEKGECERPPEKVSWPKITDQQVKLYSGFCNFGHADRAEHPVNCVAWPMADTFCKKRGGRLPTEAEWEYAARGASQRKYPWGEDPPSPKYLNACGKSCAKWFEDHGEKHGTMYDGDDDGFIGTAPVGSFPAGATAAGVLDLAGNVWEWTADWYAAYGDAPATDPKGPATGTQRVLRGGDFSGTMADWARPAYRWKTDPETTFNHAIGFRCAAALR